MRLTATELMSVDRAVPVAIGLIHRGMAVVEIDGARALPREGAR